MRLLTWPRRASDAGNFLFGYDSSLLSEVATVVRRQRSVASLGVAALIAGTLLLLAGVGLGILAVGLGMLLVSYVDRRLFLLTAVAVTPGLTVFYGIALATVGGSTLDVRLLLTAILAVVLWIWLAVDRPRLDATAGVFVVYVLIALLLVVLNNAAPLKALPVLARDLVYLGAFLGARAWLGTTRGAHAVLIAASIGLLVPAVSGLIQWATGGGLVAAGVWRLSGLYGSSPVGFALAMQLGVIVLAGGALTEGFARRLRWVAGILAVALMAVMLVQTSSRLPFVTTVAAVTAFEVVRRRWIGVAVVALLSAVLVVSSAGLAARVGSTFVPTATPGTAGVPATPTPSALPVATAAPNSETEDDDLGGGAASLRYRLFVWRTMLGEWTQSPLLGRGTGSFATLLEKRTGMHRVAPHNDYLYALVEGGIVLLGAYVALQLILVFGLLVRAIRGVDARLPLVALACFGVMNVANAINNAIFYVDLQLIVWVVVGSVLASSAFRARTTAPAASGEATRVAPSGGE